MKLAASLDQGLHRRLVDGLCVEAMVMADEARAYFDLRDGGDADVDDPVRRVAFACESLKVTTRLMHIIAWLLSQRAWQRGELSDAEMLDEKYRSEEHTSELQSLMRISYAVFCLKKKTKHT